MRKTRHITTLGAAATALALLLTGCGGSDDKTDAESTTTGETTAAGPTETGGDGGETGGETAAGEGQYGGDLVMVREGDATTLLPTGSPLNRDIWIDELIYEPLLAPSADGKSLEPLLAESYESNDDATVWTFHLREGLTFHDGTPVTAADAKFSIETASDPETPFGFVNDAIVSVEAPDDLTVVITTAQPWSPLPSDAAIFSNGVIPKDYGGKTAEEFGDHPIGTGPFMFESWDKGNELKLVRNPNYWREGLPYLDSVTFRTVPEENNRALQLQSGDAHINEFPAYSSLDGLASSSDLTATAFNSSRTDFLAYNVTRSPTDDVHLRRALGYAIDREALNDAVLYGYGTPGTAYINPALWGHYAELDAITYDVEKAKEELAQSSMADGGTLSVIVESGAPNEMTVAQVLQENFAAIGIELQIDQVDGGALYDVLASKNYDMVILYCTTDIIDPDQMIRFIGDVDGGYNAMYSWYHSDELVALADEAATINDQAQRKALYDQIQTIFNDDQPVSTLFYSPAVYSYTTKLHNFSVLPTGNYMLTEAWLEQ
ncbi:MAG: ABC transporter substrate-binding protein [Bifidobacteriaceae bacterium]|jgi:peptide/nickel transport system substrate-binding protein|nr:ABC transporter substrate-binding protein [Bifidobacteriaceae bacterium]